MAKKIQNGEVAQVEVQAQEVNVEMKKEEKKMSESKKVEKAQEDVRFQAYRKNEAGEYLMTEEMLKEFLEVNAGLKVVSSKADVSKKGIRNESEKKPFATVRISEDAKKKQVHVRTGATKKTVSAKAEDGVRYKVIFREKTQKYECWNATPDGKRKMLKRGTQEEVMAEYESHFQKVEKKGKKLA